MAGMLPLKKSMEYKIYNHRMTVPSHDTIEDNITPSKSF